MSLDRCGDPGWVRHCLHISLAKLREPPTPIFHPEHEARGECSPFKFQSASITPCPIPRTSGLSTPPQAAPPPAQASIPGFSGLPACVPIDLRELPARKTGV